MLLGQIDTYALFMTISLNHYHFYTKLSFHSQFNDFMLKYQNPNRTQSLRISLFLIFWAKVNEVLPYPAKIILIPALFLIKFSLMWS